MGDDEKADPSSGEAEHTAYLPDEVEESLGAVSFEGLSPTQFEEFCFDLLSASGFVNVDWRKGTPKDSSPADGGRDIVAEFEREDVDGHHHREVWFIDCKHYKRGVPPDALDRTLTWAQAERPSVVLFMASGYLSNPAKDWIAKYCDQSRPPFRVRAWELPQIRRLLTKHLDVAFRHDVHTETLRRVSDILSVEAELTDRLWYGRKPSDGDYPADWSQELIEQVRLAKCDVEARFGVEMLEADVASDWAWGFLSGKVSAIRWVLGHEWDLLDS